MINNIEIVFIQLPTGAYSFLGFTIFDSNNNRLTKTVGINPYYSLYKINLF